MLGALAWTVYLVRFGAADWSSQPPPYDAWAYHEAARNVEAGTTPYRPIPPGPHVVGSLSEPAYLYPPPLAAMLAATTDTFAGTYRLILLMAAFGVAALSYAVGRLTGTGWIGAGCVALLLFASDLAPGMAVVGNVQPFVDGMAALAIVSAPPLAAFLLASGVAVKVTPLWALGVVLARARGARIGFGAAVLCWAGVTLSVMGWGGTVDGVRTWLVDVAPNLGQGQFTHDWWVTLNISPAFAPLYLLDHPPGVDLPAWARTYLTAMQLGVPALVLYLTRRFPWNMQAGWVLVASALSAPILRIGYLPILLLAPALYWRRRAPLPADRRRAGGMAPARPAARAPAVGSADG